MAQFRDTAAHAENWDAFSGGISGLPDPQNIDFELEPYESRLIFLSDAAIAAAPKRRNKPETVVADLSRQWKVTFGEGQPTVEMDRLSSWSDDRKTRFYSGRATYEKSFDLPPGSVRPGSSFVLDFGPGTPEPLPSPPGRNNMRAYLVPPIREVAQVYVNGKLAGDVWRPPYRLDVARFVHEGKNDLRVVVGNTAINELAGHPQPDYRLLWDRYGMLFVPQDMENLVPLPSGILGPVKLMESSPTE
jgi:hypothetical protein